MMVVDGWWLVVDRVILRRLGVWRTQGTSENELGNYEHDSKLAATPRT